MAIVRKSSICQAVKQFFKTSTLHGFKYLLSEYYSDRIGWLLCCCASACCAGVLCVVLWARFLDMPAILVLCGIHGTVIEQQFPVVVICPEPESFLNNYFQQTSRNGTWNQNISSKIADLFSGKTLSPMNQKRLVKFLEIHNITLREIMTNYSLDCEDVVQRCRYQKVVVPCEDLFEKIRTMAGMCCVMRPNKLKMARIPPANSYITQMLDLVLQCGSSGTKQYNCLLDTIFEGEDTEPQFKDSHILVPGLFYMAQLQFSAVPEVSNSDQLVQSNLCSSETDYSVDKCVLKCAEKVCGCVDPLFSPPDPHNELPDCSVTKMTCLRTYENEESDSCECLPSCKKVYEYMMLESSPMNALEHSIDSFYVGINTTQSMIANIRVNVGVSRLFEINPTETWLTLLSSLGGVFNMFLGVGLFSALELVYMIFVKLPIAAKKTSEIEPTVSLPSYSVQRF